MKDQLDDEQIEDEVEEPLQDVAEDEPEEDAELADDVEDDAAKDADEPKTDEADEPTVEDVAAFTVTIGGDEDGDIPDGPKPLRDAHKKAKQRIRELEAQVKEQQGSGQTVELGPKPTLEGMDYDADKFEAELLAWTERKRKADEVKQAEEARQAEFAKQYTERLDSYQKAKTALGAQDFEDAEEIVRDTLSTARQSIIVANAKKPEILIYALGKNPKVLEELNAAPDAISFAYRLAQLETNLKVTGMKSKPKPEKRLAGKSAPALSSDSQLERLRAKAAETGDFTEVRAYKAKLRDKER